MKNALYVLIGLMAGFALAGLLFFVSRAPAGEPILLQPAPTKAPIAVHVLGAVPRPGLYELPEGARVQNAVDAAGGLLTDANADKLNLAALLEDGQQLNIPYKDGAGPATEEAALSPEDGTDPNLTDPNLTDGADSELLNINTATLEEFDALPGIGPTIAQRIIDYRDELGGYFSSIEDLLNVSGIGEQTFQEIEFLITVY